MTRVIAFVEGRTEETFVEKALAPALVARHVFLSATTPGRRRCQGGVPSWTRCREDLLRFLKNDVGLFVTTMFDYYGMPPDWPERSEVSGNTSQRAKMVEEAILEDVSEKMGDTFDRQRFIPYVQMHEFEALLFSDPDILGRQLGIAASKPDMTARLQSILADFSCPEDINDSPDTAPSKRIGALCPQYQKVVDGNNVAKQMGLDCMRKACPHFHDWVAKLEVLGTPPQ